MPRRDTASIRDDDLDHRPFGDSHFGDAGRERLRPHRPRVAMSEAGRDSRPDGESTAELPDSSPHFWHEGFFEEFDSTPAPQTARKHAGHRGQNRVGDMARPQPPRVTQAPHGS
jgi:hypothetical protein